MIRQSSIALGELIAAGNPDFKPTNIILGLNGETNTFDGYSDNFRKELIEATNGDGSEHTAFMQAGSGRLAEIILGAMENISTYGKPLAMAVAKEARVCYSRSQLKDTAGQFYKHSFIALDDPFFDSPIYPTEVKDKQFEYINVGLNDLRELTFNFPSEEQVLEFVNSNHGDIVEILRERDVSAASAAFLLSDMESLQYWFSINKNGNFDFSRIKHLESEKLLKAYIILTKMYGSENPVPWLATGSLDKYRTYVNLLWNGMTLYMINLKHVVGKYRDAGLVIVDQTSPRLLDGKDATQAGIKFIDVESTIYYTDAVMENITSRDCSMSEVVLGWFWGRLQGESKPILDIVKDPEFFQKKAQSYYMYVNEKMIGHARGIFINKALETIAVYIEGNANVSERLQEVRKGSHDLLATWVIKTFGPELEQCYYSLNEAGINIGDTVIDGEDSGTNIMDVIMSSKLVPTFLAAIGCATAANLLLDTFITQTDEDNVANQRERLHVAVINFIVNQSLE